MFLLKKIINYFNVETSTRPNIVNILRPRMLFNMFLFVFTRKLNFMQLCYQPINLMLEVSTVCNLNCPTCERELYKTELSGLPSENVKLEKIKKLSSVLPYVYSVYMVGGLGEPFLNPEFWEIHKFLKKFRVKTAYFSNASTINEEIIEKTFKEKVNAVLISIDTFDKEKYCKIKKGGSYNNAVRVIQMFAEYKKNMKVRNFNLGLNFIFRRDNYNDIIPYLEFAKNVGVDFVHCSTLITHLERDEDLSFFLLPENIQEEVIKNAEAKAKELKIGIRLPSLKKDEQQGCDYLWRCLSVFYNGDVCACPYFRTKRNFYYHLKNEGITYQKKLMDDTVVGNYLVDDIKEIWNGAKILHLRKGQLKNELAPSPCDTCYYKYNLH
jgi:MoaA/NifB/PqqE/SkfB family radical SAM enzyme